MEVAKERYQLNTEKLPASIDMLRKLFSRSYDTKAAVHELAVPRVGKRKERVHCVLSTAESLPNSVSTNCSIHCILSKKRI